MPNIKNTRKSFISLYLGKILIISAIILLLLIFIFHYTAVLFDNRAADIARPIANDLRKAGASKLCDGGDLGRGPDTSAAYYGMVYETSLQKDAAVSLIERITKNEGYNLVHATPDNRGPLDSIADAYIGSWYFDDSSKQNPYSDIQAGPITLTISINEPGMTTGCKVLPIVSKDHTVIITRVQLPDFKH